jgi:hypothetical protein
MERAIIAICSLLLFVPTTAWAQQAGLTEENVKKIKNVRKQKTKEWNRSMKRISIVEEDIASTTQKVAQLTKQFNRLDCGQKKPPIEHEDRCDEIGRKLNEQVERAVNRRAERARLLSEAYERRSEDNAELSQMMFGRERPGEGTDEATPKMNTPYPDVESHAVTDLYARIDGYGLTKKQAQKRKNTQSEELERARKLKQYITASGRKMAGDVSMAKRAAIKHRHDEMMAKFYQDLAGRYEAMAKFVGLNNIGGTTPEDPGPGPDIDWPSLDVESSGSGGEGESVPVTGPRDRSTEGEAAQHLE